MAEKKITKTFQYDTPSDLVMAYLSEVSQFLNCCQFSCDSSKGETYKIKSGMGCSCAIGSTWYLAGFYKKSNVWYLNVGSCMLAFSACHAFMYNLPLISCWCFSSQHGITCLGFRDVWERERFLHQVDRVVRLQQDGAVRLRARGDSAHTNMQNPTE